MSVPISRPHLFEFIDQPWYPEELRNLQTEGLSRFMGKSFEVVAPVIRETMQAGGTSRIVDLCSGGGGPWPGLYPLVSEAREVELTLTDAYPNPARYQDLRRALGEQVEFWGDPVDAQAVPTGLTGMRTMFSAFHHLRPEKALAVLRDARDAGVPIAIFDVASGRADLASLIRTFVFFSLFAPIMNVLFYWALTPSLGHLSWQRLFFTYVIPVVPFVTAWDGMVSGLRSYTLGELREMASRLDSDDYVWEVGELSAKPMQIYYIAGRPRSG